MKAETGETIALHLQRDGPEALHPDPEAAAQLGVQSGQLVPMERQAEPEIPMGLERIRTVEIETQAYKGPTTVIPRVGAEVVLPTKGYKLLKNVTVEEVQISAVSAPGGGLVYRIE